MSSICGIYYFEKKSGIDRDVNAMVNTLNHWSADKTGAWSNEQAGLGCLLLYNTPESLREELPFHDPESQCTITATSRIDNRKELFQQLHFRNKSFHIPDAVLMLEAYKKWKENCLDYLTGDFAFVIYDKQNDSFFCGKDHIGTKPFYYYRDKEKFVFASEMKAILALPNIRCSLNELWIADALSTVKSDKHCTLYHEIYRLPPAHFCLVKNKQVKTIPYWKLIEAEKVSYKNDNDYIEHFRELMKQAVNNRLRTAFPIGSEVSGGLDSSVVTSFAADKTELSAFSHVLPNELLHEYDDSEKDLTFINAIIDKKNIKHSFIITSEEYDILNALKHSVFLNDAPIHQNFQTFSDALYDKAHANGVRTMLSGFGGDELVTAGGSGYLNELAHHHRLMLLLKELYQRDRKKNKSIHETILQYGNLIIKAIFLRNYSKKHHRQKENARILEKYGGLAIHADFAEKYNIRDRALSRLKFPDMSNMNERLLLRVSHNHLNQRLEYSYHAALSKKMEYRFPLLDKRLMEFYFRVPNRLKVRNGWGRYICRRASEGIVPPGIQWRYDKGGPAIPTVHMRYRNDYENVLNFIREASGKDIYPYVDHQKLLPWAERMRNKDTSKYTMNPMAFYNTLSVLLFQFNQINKQ